MASCTTADHHRDRESAQSTIGVCSIWKKNIWHMPLGTINNPSAYTACLFKTTDCSPTWRIMFCFDFSSTQTMFRHHPAAAAFQ